MVINLQGLPQPDNARCDMTGFAEFVAVHAQYGREQFPVAEVPSDAQRPAGPPGGGGQLFLRKQVAERDPEGHPGLGQQPHGFKFGVPGGDAGFQPGDQWPQLADRIGGPPAMASDVGQSDDGCAECEHGGEVGVVRADDTEHVRRYGQRAGDMSQGAAVGDAATTALDHGNVGPVEAQQIRQVLLGQPAGVPVTAQDRSHVPSRVTAGRPGQPGRSGEQRTRRG